MKAPPLFLYRFFSLILCSLAGISQSAQGQQFDCGSDGSYGPINVAANATTTLSVPADGIFHCTTVTVESGATLKFTKNVANTPVYLLTTGDVTISGTIDVSGSNGQTNGTPGRGGPGGWDGGHGFQMGAPSGGAGQGPGGGKTGRVQIKNFGSDNNNTVEVGHGVYAGGTPTRPNNGVPYGGHLLIPLVGGSGGGGTDSATGFGGGGGGGAILVASNSKISFQGGASLITARGGQGVAPFQSNYYSGFGSGGSIRLVAPTLEGSPVLYASSDTGSGFGLVGRIRIDGIYRSAFMPASVTGSMSSGSNMMIFAPSAAKIEIIEAAGQTVAPNSGLPVTVLLGQSAPASQTVKVRVTNFNGTAQLRVVLTPDFGAPSSANLDILNPGPGPAEGTANVTLAPNQLSRVDVWTR